MKIRIGTVDDHQLFSKSLGMMLASFQNFEVVLDAINGLDLQEKIKKLQKKPDILLIDVNMPLMNGVQTANWMKENFPDVKLAALSMNDNDQSIIEMFSAGCCAYLFKDTHPDDFELALNQIYTIGYYNSDPNLINLRKKSSALNETVQLSEKEKQFLLHACSEKTYEQIAKAMSVSERTVDGYRESVFRKLSVQTRTGMALEAIRRGYIKL
ncbi:MAG TPA: DNA-binding response regulator [Cytophagales bacterium]|jgi:DNA-binding NarL/FixJ family response regulator|nr:DNA-binding response regulator [Cytophagales bacterium]